MNCLYQITKDIDKSRHNSHWSCFRIVQHLKTDKYDIFHIGSGDYSIVLAHYVTWIYPWLNQFQCWKIYTRNSKPTQKTAYINEVCPIIRDYPWTRGHKGGCQEDVEMFNVMQPVSLCKHYGQAKLLHNLRDRDILKHKMVFANTHTISYEEVSPLLNFPCHNYRPRSRGDNTFGSLCVCLFVCLSVRAPLFEPFDLPPWFLAWGLTLTLAMLVL